MPAHRGLAVGQLDPVEGDGVLTVPDGSGRRVVVVLVSLSSRLMVGLPSSSSSSCSTTDNPLGAGGEKLVMMNFIKTKYKM